MDKNYYIEYFDLERNNWWFKARLNIIASQIKKHFNGKTNLRILNIGVATGATSQMLEQFGEVKSIEYDKDCYEFVKQRLNIDLQQGSILDLKFNDNSFDLVCAFDVIEHVEDDNLALLEMFRVCNSNGLVFITVPAFMVLWSYHDIVNHHYRRYTLLQLKNLLRNKGKIVFSSYFNTLLFLPILAVRITSKLLPFLFKRKGSGSDFAIYNPNWLNNLLYRLFMLENFWLNLNFKFPFGVSAMIIAKKYLEKL